MQLKKHTCNCNDVQNLCKQTLAAYGKDYRVLIDNMSHHFITGWTSTECCQLQHDSDYLLVGQIGQARLGYLLQTGHP